jgi:hypothetical protein
MSNCSVGWCLASLSAVTHTETTDDDGKLVSGEVFGSDLASARSHKEWTAAAESAMRAIDTTTFEEIYTANIFSSSSSSTKVASVCLVACA